MPLPDDFSQLRKGLTEFCLLALLERAPCHGYELVARLADTRMLALSESTVYPVLARFRTRGWVETAAAPSERGPARKVIRLTAAGRDRLAEWRARWALLAGEMDQLTAAPPSGPLSG